MQSVTVCFVMVGIVLGAGCPNYCFCYMSNGLLRTDCIRKNLFNTFLKFSHRTQILDLSHNVIPILHGNEFLDANLKQLQDLRLSNNLLHKIDKLSFNGLQLLQNLDLSFNSIEYLNPSTFRYNSNLKSLNISFNPLSLKKDEPFLVAASSLRVLDMANCRLNFVTPHMFSELTSLRVLNISRSNIRPRGFLERMNTVRHMDFTENDFLCNDQSEALIQNLIKRKIQFKPFCQPSQKMGMIAVEEKEASRTELEVHQKEDEKGTEKVFQKRSLLNDIKHFFQSIPSFYVIVCSVQVGIFIGSFSTYFCMKKPSKNQKRNNEETVDETYGARDSNNTRFTLTSLNTPPGTPPSPYHSRIFPSNFSVQTIS